MLTLVIECVGHTAHVRCNLTEAERMWTFTPFHLTHASQIHTAMQI